MQIFGKGAGRVGGELPWSPFGHVSCLSTNRRPDRSHLLQISVTGSYTIGRGRRGGGRGGFIVLKGTASPAQNRLKVVWLDRSLLGPPSL